MPAGLPLTPRLRQGRIKEGWGPGASCECEAPFSSLGLLLIDIKIFGNMFHRIVMFNPSTVLIIVIL